MAWTDDRVELLKKLWARGLSARQIADQLGGVTRNAVIGKVHRLGLSGRATTTPVRSKAARPKTAHLSQLKAVEPIPPQGADEVKTAEPLVQPAPSNEQAAKSARGPEKPVREERIPKTIAQPIEELVVPPEDRVTIENLKESQCKWPIGDPTEDDFHFCGQNRHGEGVYCEFHAARAYQPARRPVRKKEIKLLAS